jgi:hypothetical protein
MQEVVNSANEHFTPTGPYLEQTNFYEDVIMPAHDYGQRVFTSSADNSKPNILVMLTDIVSELYGDILNITVGVYNFVASSAEMSLPQFLMVLRVVLALLGMAILIAIGNMILRFMCRMGKKTLSLIFKFCCFLLRFGQGKVMGLYYYLWTLQKFKASPEGVVISDSDKELVTYNSMVCLRIKFRDEYLLIPIKDGLMLAAAGGPPSVPPPKSQDIMEKALDGSTMRLSTSWPKGVVALATAESKVMGMGCRCKIDGKDVLLTAAHVLKAMSFIVGDLFMVNDERKMPFSRTEPIVMISTGLDVVAVEIKASVWTALGVKQLSFNFDVKSNPMGVKLYGYSGGKLAVSEGRYRPNSIIIVHYASTQPSWSGTPLIADDGKIVGVHRAAGLRESGKRDYNIASSIKWLEVNRNETSKSDENTANQRDKDIKTWENRKEAREKRKFGDESKVNRFSIEYKDRDIVVAATTQKYNYNYLPLSELLAEPNSWDNAMNEMPEFNPDEYLGDIESVLSPLTPKVSFGNKGKAILPAIISVKREERNSRNETATANGVEIVPSGLAATTKPVDTDLQVIMEQNSMCYDLTEEKDQKLIYGSKFYEAGKSHVKFYFQSEKPGDGKLRYVKKFSKSRPEVLNYAWPQRTDATEKLSVETHATKYMPVWNLEMSKAMKKSLESYIKAFIPKYRIPDSLEYALIKNNDAPSIWREKSGFNDVIMYIDSSRNPGSPYVKYGTTNAVVLKTELERITSIVRARMVMLGDSKTVIKDNPTENLKAGLYDPIRFFNKYEPTKLTKIEEHRERLISSVSLADRIVSQMLIAPLNATQKENWKTSDHTMGFGIRKEEDIKNVVDRFTETYSDSKLHHVDLDATAWDWQFGEVGYDIEAYIIMESCINPTVAFLNAIQNLKQLEKRKIFQFSKGDMIAQVTPGLVASGKYDTTQQNSNVNGFLMYYFGAVNRRVAGDDGLAAFKAGFRERYREANMSMKFNDIVKQDGKFEFCSNYWGIDKTGKYFSYPVHYEKMVFKFLSQNYDKLAEFEELKRELSDHPLFEQIVSEIEDLELPLEEGEGAPIQEEDNGIQKSA